MLPPMEHACGFDPSQRYSDEGPPIGAGLCKIALHRCLAQLALAIEAVKDKTSRKAQRALRVLSMRRSSGSPHLWILAAPGPSRRF